MDTENASLSLPPSDCSGSGVAGIDRNCLSYWFPIIEKAGLPVPKTEIFRTDAKLWELCDGIVPEGIEPLIAQIGDSGDRLGWPCFLRTGHTSGKHDWERTCFLPSREAIPAHMGALVEYSEMASIIGLPSSVWVVREMLPVHPLYRCTRFHGMPVVPEVRAFVDGERVAYIQPYWPEGALEQGQPDCENWRDTYRLEHSIRTSQRLCCEDLASRAGKAVGGRWSVDLLQTDRGWYLTDMALAEESFGYDETRFRSPNARLQGCAVAHTLQGVVGSSESKGGEG